VILEFIRAHFVSMILELPMDWNSQIKSN